MKVSLGKTDIEIKWYTCLYILVYSFSIYHKVLFYIFIVLSLHELGHILAAIFLRLKIEKLTVYPFGIAMEVCNIDYIPSYNELLVAMGGPLMYFVISTLFLMLFNYDIISLAMYNYIVNINRNILLFNLLPIYPLDGGRITKAFIHVFITYKRGLIIAYMGSLILSLVLISNYRNFYAIYFFILIIMLILQLFKIENSRQHFYLYKYLHNPKLPIKIHYKADLYRNKYNYLLVNNDKRICSNFGLNKEALFIDEQQFILNHLNNSNKTNMNDTNFMI